MNFININSKRLTKNLSIGLLLTTIFVSDSLALGTPPMRRAQLLQRKGRSGNYVVEPMTSGEKVALGAMLVGIGLFAIYRYYNPVPATPSELDTHKPSSNFAKLSHQNYQPLPLNLELQPKAAPVVQPAQPVEKYIIEVPQRSDAERVADYQQADQMFNFINAQS